MRATKRKLNMLNSSTENLRQSIDFNWNDEYDKENGTESDTGEWTRAPQPVETWSQVKPNGKVVRHSEESDEEIEFNLKIKSLEGEQLREEELKNEMRRKEEQKEDEIIQQYKRQPTTQ